MLLILLSILLLALTAGIIAQISLNKLRAEKNRNDAKLLQEANESLLAYAVTQAVVGTLPCPDTDANADGLENRAGTNCSSSIGRLPYRTLGIDNLTDSGGASLWYAVAPAYTDNGGLVPRNSSLVSNYVLDGRQVPALAISPGKPLPGQQRVPVTIAGFLEGENANASVDTYAQVGDETNNDLLNGLAVGRFWSLMEKKPLNEISALLTAYKTACTEYPWAANFAAGADDSVNAMQVGSVPLDVALPADWNTGCALGIEPSAELRNNWRDQIYYHFCLTSEGNCLSVQGDVALQAEAVLIAPGNLLAAQNRATQTLANFFEDENASGDTPYKYLKPINYDGTFNDSLKIVAP